MKWPSSSTCIYLGLTLLVVFVHARSIPSGQQVIMGEALRYESFTYEHSGEVRRYESDRELLQILRVSRVPTRNPMARRLLREFILLSAGSGR